MPVRGASGARGDHVKDKIYGMVTEKIIAALENGTVPWRQPWNPAYGRPLRMNNGKPYRGINVLLLGLSADQHHYTSPYWGTYDHIAEASGMVKDAASRWVSPDGTPRGVRKGERGELVVFWRQIRVKDADAEDGTKIIPLLRYYKVFNACQADALPERFYPKPREASGAAELPVPQSVLDGYLANDGPALIHGGNVAGYDPVRDEIVLPERALFTTDAGYYYSGFHESGHSTGHPRRLNRPGVQPSEVIHFGSQRYSKEELAAEMTAAMVMAETGLSTDDSIAQNAAYISGWLSKLRDDQRLVVLAAAQAQRATDLIMGREEEAGEMPVSPPE